MGVRAKTPEEIFCPTNTPGPVLQEGKKLMGYDRGILGTRSTAGGDSRWLHSRMDSMATREHGMPVDNSVWQITSRQDKHNGWWKWSLYQWHKLYISNSYMYIHKIIERLLLFLTNVAYDCVCARLRLCVCARLCLCVCDRASLYHTRKHTEPLKTLTCMYVMWQMIVCVCVSVCVALSVYEPLSHTREHVVYATENPHLPCTEECVGCMSISLHMWNATTTLFVYSSNKPLIERSTGFGVQSSLPPTCNHVDRYARCPLVVTRVRLQPHGGRSGIVNHPKTASGTPIGVRLFV